MNVQTRKDFERVLYLLQHSEIIVADTETTGLNPHHEDKMFSLSVYFPEPNESYNLSFRAGSPSQTEDSTPEAINALSWSGKERKTAYLNYWYNRYRTNTNFQNLPLSWLDELKAVWGKGRYIMHNARFDMHVLRCEGFPDMEYVEDTMLALHLVNEDFRRVPLEAPFLWTERDAKPDVDKKTGKVYRDALCPKEDVGKWARGEDGKLLKKLQNGNRRLKWFAAFLELPNATVGEEGLAQAISEFENDLIDFICQYPDDSTNEFALIRHKATKKKEAFASISRARVASKIKIDDKANMWMLPSSKTAYYAELDTILTWGLREWCMTVIKDWNNEQLYNDVCRIQQHALFPMEYHGIRLDIKAAQEEINRLAPRITELEHLLAKEAGKWGFKQFDLSEVIEDVDLSEDEEDEKLFNLASPQQLIELLNSGVLAIDYGLSLFPPWFPPDMAADLKTYADVQIDKTNKEALDEIEGHPIVRIIRFYRLMKKSCDTYLRRWLGAIDSNGFMHPNFFVDGTVTGRVASSGSGQYGSGNLQNIPTRGYYRIASAIIAPKGYKIAALDYRTLEMGIAAAIAEGGLGLPAEIGTFDANMPLLLELRKPDADVHSKTRDMVDIRNVVFPNMSDKDILIKQGYDPETIPEASHAKSVNKICRQIAKTLNFGLLYAGTAKMVSRLLKIDREPAEVLVQRWKKVYPAYAKAQAYYTKLSLTRRPVPSSRGTAMYATQPISGRHRKLHKYPTWMYYTKYGRRQGFNPQEAASRKVWNAMVQGLGGYFCTMSLLRYYEKYGYDHLIAFAQIHDALEVYVKEGSEVHLKYLAECMVNWEIDPGLRVDVAVSTSGNWQDMKSLGSKDDYTYGRGEEWNNPHFEEAFNQWALTKGAS